MSDRVQREDEPIAFVVEKTEDRCLFCGAELNADRKCSANCVASREDSAREERQG